MTSLSHLQYVTRSWIAVQRCRARGPHPKDAEARTIAQTAERVLLVIAGLLGDTVMSTPVITAARRVWPNARLTLLGQRHNCELLADCTELDDRIESRLPFGVSHRREVAEVQARVAAGRFDVALLVLGDQFASMMCDAGIPVRVGVGGNPLAGCLTHQYEIGSPRTWGPDERLNALRVLGFDVPSIAPSLRPSAATIDCGVSALGRLGLAPGVPYAVVHPFGSTPRQWWPVERVSDLRRQLDARYGVRTVLIGGPETRDAVPAALASQVEDARGQLSLTELVGVLDRAAIVVSTDSGPYHIAGALGRPLVGLFRHRRPEHADKYPQARVVFGGYQACASECEWDRCAAAECRQMSRISVDEILRAVATAVHPRPAETAR